MHRIQQCDLPSAATHKSLALAGGGFQHLSLQTQLVTHTHTMQKYSTHMKNARIHTHILVFTRRSEDTGYLILLAIQMALQNVFQFNRLTPKLIFKDWKSHTERRVANSPYGVTPL
ncbi:hypothetical protein PoB_006320600 [Plakobranchus ocellatus]|uniref:Uncharacterized protein n=1 Tax=Plakobranchus ocellatus TaxID=259542 RepID=A0AAV4CXS2_9GAST|nr:hypothetical protein PoB_006320600 [Plakobranchus ocellatus]